MFTTGALASIRSALDLIVGTLGLLATLTAVASDREDDVNRTNQSAQAFREIMNTPDQGIAQDLLNSAKCIAIIPGNVKSPLYSAAAMAEDWRHAAPSMAGARPCSWPLIAEA